MTGLTKDGIENLKYASATYELKKASRTINCRDGPDNTSKKLDDIPKDALVRIIEEKAGADGKMWAWVAKGDSQVKEPIGWIQVSKEQKGVEVSMLDSITPLKLEFDLRVHTAKSLSPSSVEYLRQMSLSSATTAFLVTLNNATANAKANANNGPDWNGKWQEWAENFWDCRNR